MGSKPMIDKEVKVLLDMIDYIKRGGSSIYHQNQGVVKRAIRCRSVSTSRRLELLSLVLLANDYNYRRFVYFQLKNDRELRKHFVDLIVDDSNVELIPYILKESCNRRTIFDLLPEPIQVLIALKQPYFIDKMKRR